MARMTRVSTVPSPTPASKRRRAGGRGLMLASSMATRLATTHFSEQVFTKSRYFCRLSKKRKFSSVLPLEPLEAAAGTEGFDTGTSAVPLSPLAVG